PAPPAAAASAGAGLAGAGLAGAGLAGAGLAGAGLAGAGRWPLPEAKSNPHTSQNCPVRPAPHCGQGSAEGTGGAGDPAAGAPADGMEAADGAGAAAPSIRIPHTSQKSLLAESWPLGQVGMPPHFFVRTVLVDLVSSAISSASSTCFFSRTVPDAASTTSTT